MIFTVPFLLGSRMSGFLVKRNCFGGLEMLCAVEALEGGVLMG